MAKIWLIQQPISTIQNRGKHIWLNNAFRPFWQSKKNYNFEFIECSGLKEMILALQGSSLGSTISCARVSRISKKPLQKGKTRSFTFKDRVLNENTPNILFPTLVRILSSSIPKGSSIYPQKIEFFFFMDQFLFLKTRSFPLSYWFSRGHLLYVISIEVSLNI